MYFDEDLVLDVRLNILDKYVDYFVIVESIFNHKGEKRSLKFDIEKFKSFKNKIKYLVCDELPDHLEEITQNDFGIPKEKKFINNAVKRENFQRNFIQTGLVDANSDDFILISDLDEIPNLQNIVLDNVNEKIVIFKQIMTYYKFNLSLPNYWWHGTKGCLKKNLKSPQWLRNIKSKKYPLLRLDIIFSNLKYNNIRIVDNGGWHFTNIKTPEDIELKLKSYLHHREFELSKTSLNDIYNVINNKNAIYNLGADQRNWKKIGTGKKLENLSESLLPKYVVNNRNKFSDWLD
tara:strand:+ start:246 stop:1118 length:873 start_codon:yes stop_codon:yes gene_type:complete